MNVIQFTKQNLSLKYVLGVLCDEPVCAKGCSSENGVCDRPGECTCK